MAKIYEAIDEKLRDFIARQKMFFVATAPSGPDGHVNLSPKGYDTFRILDPHTVAYLDLTGSGAETIAHLRDNGRIVLMFTAFEGPPNILRLYGRGEVLEPGEADFEPTLAAFHAYPGVRSVIRVRVERIADSCGYAVPLYEYVGERSQLEDWAERKGADGVARYRQEHNAESIDGLPALRRR